MRDGLGSVDSLLMFGGTSEIGLAIVKRLRPKRRVVLFGRNADGLEQAARDLRSATSATVSVHHWDAAGAAHLGPDLRSVFDDGDIDVVLVAAGSLGHPWTAEGEPDDLVEMASVTYTGALNAMLWSVHYLARQGHGSLVVLSSVAGIRPRSSNFIYGSAKAGLDFAARGLQAPLRRYGVEVVVVRPGFVRTRMTRGLPEAPFTIDPDDVAAIVTRAIGRGSRTVYAPAVLAPVMGVLRHLPRAVFARLDR